MKAARRTLADIQRDIANGVYDRSRYFGGGPPTPSQTFREYGDEWLKTLTSAKSTKRSYKTALDSTWYPAFGEKALGDIRHSDIKRAIALKMQTVSGKTVNNHLVVVRAVFDMAVKDKLIPDDPTAGIENVAHQSPEPDPFTTDEMDAILAHMEQKYDEQVWNYYTFAFHTGMRPSEIISLRWGDIDWTKRTARVQRARVDWEEKGTKTNKVRDVRLYGEAFPALQRQKVHTFMRGLDAEVFNNPITNRAWPDEQVQRRRYFTPALKALGLRHRDAYQTRHTFATAMLMGGIKIGHIASQLGHAKITTTLSRYARWLEDADAGTEAAKADAILSRKSPRNARKA